MQGKDDAGVGGAETVPRGGGSVVASLGAERSGSIVRGQGMREEKVGRKEERRDWSSTMAARVRGGNCAVESGFEMAAAAEGAAGLSGAEGTAGAVERSFAGKEETSSAAAVRWASAVSGWWMIHSARNMRCSVVSRAQPLTASAHRSRSPGSFCSQAWCRMSAV
jgi:hypothetical protein